jgi:hypothetical protein
MKLRWALLGQHGKWALSWFRVLCSLFALLDSQYHFGKLEGTFGKLSITYTTCASTGVTVANWCKKIFLPLKRKITFSPGGRQKNYPFSPQNTACGAAPDGAPKVIFHFLR